MLQVTRGPSLLIDLLNALYVPGKVFAPANSQRGILLTWERVAETPKQIDKPAINVLVVARQIALSLRVAKDQIDAQGLLGPASLEPDK